MHINLNQLRIFHSAARTESFTRAAQALCLTQPGISKHIRQLEEDVGVALFDRLGKKVVPTQAGRILLEATTAVFQTIDEAGKRIDDLKLMRGGAITIGTSFTAGTYVIPEIPGRFHRQYPDVEIRLEIALSREIAHRVIANETDIGFLGAPYEDDRLALCPFFRDSAVVILPRDHPWLGRPSISPDQLSDQPFILPQKGSGTRTFVTAVLKSAGVTLKKPMEFGNTEILERIA
jgi:DNA-binding transcriptional LysR family regulator